MTTYRLPKLAALGLSALLLGACATPIKSSVDQAANSDLSSYSTYAWLKNEPFMSGDMPSNLANPLNYQRVRASIEAELDRKGYRKVELSEADLVLGFTLGTRDRIRVETYYDSLGYNYYGPSFGFNRFGRFGSYGSEYRQTTRTITEGTLAVDIFDGRSREAIWHGMATKSLSGDPQGKELINEAVATLIGPFPEHRVMSEMVEKLDQSDQSG